MITTTKNGETTKRDETRRDSLNVRRHYTYRFVERTLNNFNVYNERVKDSLMTGVGIFHYSDEGILTLIKTTMEKMTFNEEELQSQLSALMKEEGK